MMDAKLSKRQSEIIQTAIKLIGEGGIQALTIKNLSSGIGISESAIYRHFKSKMEVISILLDFLGSVITSNYNTIFQLNTHSFEKINSIIKEQFHLFSENPPYATVILSDGLYKNEKILQDKIFNIMETAKATFIKIIDEGTKNGEIRNDVSSEQIAFIIMGSVRLTINQWSLSGFNFDLMEKGDLLIKTLKTLLKSS